MRIESIIVMLPYILGVFVVAFVFATCANSKLFEPIVRFFHCGGSRESTLFFVIVGAYAIICTRGVTVFSYLLLFMLLQRYFFKRCAHVPEPDTPKSLRAFSLALSTAWLSLFQILRHAIQYHLDLIHAAGKHHDSYFYNVQAYYMTLTGCEVPIPSFTLTGYECAELAQPYHFVDLWFFALIQNVADWSAPPDIYLYVGIPLLGLLFLSEVSQFLDIRHMKNSQRRSIYILVHLLLAAPCVVATLVPDLRVFTLVDFPKILLFLWFLMAFYHALEARDGIRAGLLCVTICVCNVLYVPFVLIFLGLGGLFSLKVERFRYLMPFFCACVLFAILTMVPPIKVLHPTTVSAMKSWMQHIDFFAHLSALPKNLLGLIRVYCLPILLLFCSTLLVVERKRRLQLSIIFALVFGPALSLSSFLIEFPEGMQFIWSSYPSLAALTFVILVTSRAFSTKRLSLIIGLCWGVYMYGLVIAPIAYNLPTGLNGFSSHQEKINVVEGLKDIPGGVGLCIKNPHQAAEHLQRSWVHTCESDFLYLGDVNYVAHAMPVTSEYFEYFDKKTPNPYFDFVPFKGPHVDQCYANRDTLEENICCIIDQVNPPFVVTDEWDPPACVLERYAFVYKRETEYLHRSLLIPKKVP